MGNLPFNLLTFPLWWYTTGVRIVSDWASRSIRLSLHRTGLLIFAKHWKEPMFGDYTKSGMIMAMFLRPVLLVFKLAVFSLRFFWVSLGFLLYLIIFPAAIIMIIYQLFPI